MAEAAAQDRPPADMALRIAESAGLHRCWNEPADKRPATVCGCAPGRCADKARNPEPTAAQTEHPPIVDDRPFRDDREARAALTCWLEDGAEIIRRCRVEGRDATYSREAIAEIAMTALGCFDTYRGIHVDSLEHAALRQWVERELAEAEARLRAGRE